LTKRSTTPLSQRNDSDNPIIDSSRG